MQSFRLERIVQGMTYPTMQEVAGILDAARAGQGMTYVELAARTGLSARTVKAKLAGDRPIRVSELYAFAVALGTLPSEIYEQLG